MALTEIDLFGVYISPYAVILAAAWLLVFAARLVLSHLGALVHAWNPVLLVFAAFVAVFSSAVIVATSP